MTTLDFQIWSDDHDRHGQKLTVVAGEICSMRETSERRAYGGYSEVTYIGLKNGESYKVVGHVINKVKKAVES
jgi:hypothetical protein